MINYKFYTKNSNIKQLIEKNTPYKLFEIFEKSFSKIPYVDQIETTNFCNMKCKMCPRFENMDRKISVMDNNLFKKIIDELSYFEKIKQKNNINKLDFFKTKNSQLIWDWNIYDIFDLRLHHFWAPLLDPYIVDRVKYINQKSNFWTQLSETITNISIEKATELFKNNLSRLIVAFDWTNAEEFEYNRWAKIKFDMEVQKLKKIIKIKKEWWYKTQLDLQVIDLKTTNVQKFIQYWEQYDEINILHKSFFPYPDIDYSIGNIDYSEFSSECTMPYSWVSILVDWRVVSCCADYNWENILWDLNCQTLDEIRNGEKFKNFRKKFVLNLFDENSLCKRCWYYIYN